MKRFCPLCNNELIECSKNSFRCKKEITLCDLSADYHYWAFLITSRDEKLFETMFLTENIALHYCDENNYYISKLILNSDNQYKWIICGSVSKTIINDASKILEKINMILVFQ